jgi:hypothetical protein
MKSARTIQDNLLTLGGLMPDIVLAALFFLMLLVPCLIATASSQANEDNPQEPTRAVSLGIAAPRIAVNYAERAAIRNRALYLAEVAMPSDTSDPELRLQSWPGTNPSAPDQREGHANRFKFTT